MARFALLATLFAGLVCFLDHSRVLAHPGEFQGQGDASQIPNFPGPGDIPKPPGMLHSRVARQAPPEIPGQDQFPPPPPPPQFPQMRYRRDAGAPNDQANLLLPEIETTNSLAYTPGKREARCAKGTGGRLPMKAG